MTNFTYTSDTTLAQRATLGLIVLKADETIELDFRRLLPADVALHVSRIDSDADVTPQSLIKMKDRLTASANLFADASQFDCVGYACTSGSTIIGQTEVAKRVRAGCTTKSVTTPVDALVAACQHLKAKRIAILSPYVASVSDALRALLKTQAIETTAFGSFNQSNEAAVVRIDTASIIKAATALCSGAEIDALFISCTNLRTLDAIPVIEKAIGKPVLTSNTVLAWHMLELAGMKPKPDRIGHLI